MSPPCVAYFEGDNFGATARGVTKDEVRVVFLWYCTDGGANTGREFDYSDPNDPSVREEPSQFVRAWMKYFNDRYQTYGRTVRFFGSHRCPVKGAPTRALVQTLVERFDPFAIIHTYGSFEFTDEVTRRGMISNVFPNTLVRRSMMQQAAPYMFSMHPDLEGHIDTMVEFLCQKLAGRTARYSGEVRDRDRVRKFGLVYQVDGDVGGVGRTRFHSETRERCGASAGQIVNGGSDAAGVAALRSESVTTVIHLGGQPEIQAQAQQWYPEWFTNDNFANAAGAARGAEWANAFGLNYMRRLGKRVEQPAYLAYSEGCGGCEVTGYGANLSISYDLFNAFFWGIQASGPRLNAVNFDRGLHAIPARQSTSPFVPAAYFGPGDYTWIKDAAIKMWDPAGVPPDRGSSDPPAGCFRLIDEGKRYREQDWKQVPNDENFKDSRWPCQGPL